MTESMTSEEFLAQQGQPREKNPNQVLRGKRVQRDGKNFEAFIDQANAHYELCGLAKVEKLPVATQPMPKKWLHRDHWMKSGIARILSERAPFDYYGTLGMCGPAGDESRWYGRAVAMECKSTQANTRLAVGPKATLKEHQLAACATSWSRFGTVAVIVWNNGEERGVLLPNQIVHAWQQYRLGSRGSKGIPWSKFTPYPLRRIDEGPTIEDWLTPVLSFMKLHMEKADEAARNNNPRSRRR